MIWKYSRWSGNIPDDLEIFQISQKSSRLAGNLPDNKKLFSISWKCPNKSTTFPDKLQIFPKCWIKFGPLEENISYAQKLFRWQTFASEQCSGACIVFLSLRFWAATHFVLAVLLLSITLTLKKKYNL